MKWFKKIKMSLASREQKASDNRTIKEYRTAGLAKQCMHCKHFTYRTEKPRNWVCRCPDAEMRFYGNTCLGFKFGEHPEMTVMSSR